MRAQERAGTRREREEAKEESTLFSVEIAKLNDSQIFTY